MEVIETESEIISPITIRGNKAKPGTGQIYLGNELFPRMGIELDSPMVLRFDKVKKEICIKPLQY